MRRTQTVFIKRSHDPQSYFDHIRWRTACFDISGLRKVQRHRKSLQQPTDRLWHTWIPPWRSSKTIERTRHDWWNTFPLRLNNLFNLGTSRTLAANQGRKVAESYLIKRLSDTFDCGTATSQGVYGASATSKVGTAAIFQDPHSPQRKQCDWSGHLPANGGGSICRLPTCRSKWILQSSAIPHGQSSRTHLCAVAISALFAVHNMPITRVLL